MIGRWIALMDRRESPLSLALVRVLVSLVVLYDLALIGWYGLPTFLWGSTEIGGLVNYEAAFLPSYWSWLPRSEWVPIGLWVTCVASLAAFGGGFLTRFSGLIFLLTYAQTALINNAADRGIDRMIRIVLILLLFSGSGKTLSLDAKLRTGSFFGDGTLVPAWPRYLIIGQLILMYWCAGVAKFAVTWFPWGGYSALYYILQDPIYATMDWSFLAHPALYWTTQVGTAVSHAWEWTVPVLLLAYYFRATRERPGRLRAAFNRLRVREVYIVVGATFHVLLFATLHLGIFPAAMLAFYPAFFHPDEFRTLTRRRRAA